MLPELYNEIDIMVDISDVNSQVRESSKSHGGSELYKEKVFVKGESGYIPLKALMKKLEKLSLKKTFKRLALSSKVMSSIHSSNFLNGSKKKFSRKLARSKKKYYNSLSS